MKDTNALNWNLFSLLTLFVSIPQLTAVPPSLVNMKDRGEACRRAQFPCKHISLMHEKHRPPRAAPPVVKMACYYPSALRLLWWPGSRNLPPSTLPFAHPRLAHVTCETMNFIYRSGDAYRRNKRWIGPWWQPSAQMSLKFTFQSPLSLALCLFLALFLPPKLLVDPLVAFRHN